MEREEKHVHASDMDGEKEMQRVRAPRISHKALPERARGIKGKSRVSERVSLCVRVRESECGGTGGVRSIL